MNLDQLGQAHAMSNQLVKVRHNIELLEQGRKDSVCGIKFICRDDSQRKYDIDTGGREFQDAMHDAIDSYIVGLAHVRDALIHELAKLGVDAHDETDGAPKL